MYAIRSYYVDLLVKNNINVNVKDEIFGDAPVISAMLALNSESTVDNKKQCLETIKFLQSKGAVIQFYRNNGAPNESFHRVCEARYLPLIEFLVNNGAGLVINEYCLGVPAYFAYPREDNNYEPIKYLIDNGADICVKRFVITSYSIHYTKLYESSEEAQLPGAVAVVCSDIPENPTEGVTYFVTKNGNETYAQARNNFV